MNATRLNVKRLVNEIDTGLSDEQRADLDKLAKRTAEQLVESFGELIDANANPNLFSDDDLAAASIYFASQVSSNIVGLIGQNPHRYTRNISGPDVS